MRPKVSDVTWQRIYHNPTGSVAAYQAEEDDIFFKVVMNGKRPKYFYNEAAWSAVQRYIVDNGDPNGWSIF